MVILTFAQADAIRIRKSLSALLLLTFTLLFPLLQQSVVGQSSAISEFRVKATFLFQFTLFVDWPAEAFSTAQTPLVIGIFGEDPFGTFLEETVRDERANGHALAVERYRRLEEVKNCHVLFVSGSEASRTGDIVTALKGRSILIVGDSNGFADRGGMIQFVTQENRIRLRINLAAARAANLTISSKLLRPATVINPGPR